MDVRINNDECSFKMRVAGCLIKDNKLLAIQMCHNGYWCFPGGHVHVGEDTVTALKREFEEEAKIKCQDACLMSVVENFFINKIGKKFHEVSYYYLVKADDNIQTKDFAWTENDEGILKDLEFKWFNLDELKDVDLRPAVLKDKILSKNLEFEHIIFDQTKSH